MNRPPSFWKAVETALFGTLPKRTWIELFGPHASLCEKFLWLPEKRVPNSTRCPRCPRVLVLDTDHDDRVLGFPEKTCPDCSSYFEFTPDELWPWSIRHDTFLHSLSVAMLSESDVLPPTVTTLPVAFASIVTGPGRLPFFFSARHTADGYADDASSLLVAHPHPFALITVSHSEKAASLLASRNCLCIAAADHVGVKDDGSFICDDAITELLQPFRKAITERKQRHKIVLTAAGIEIVDDYRMIKFPNRQIVDLTDHPKIRAFVRYLHKQSIRTADKDFNYDTAVQNFNDSQTKYAINSDRLKHDLFKNLTREFDLLIEEVAPRSKDYRLRF